MPYSPGDVEAGEKVCNLLLGRLPGQSASSHDARLRLVLNVGRLTGKLGLVSLCSWAEHIRLDGSDLPKADLNASLDTLGLATELVACGSRATRGVSDELRGDEKRNNGADRKWAISCTGARLCGLRARC